MSNSFTRTFRGAVCAGVATIALAPSLAFAQDAAPADEAPSDEIVVTGTLIRGTTPVGSNAITLGQERLQETGATSSNELLASIPQVTNYFNRVPLSDLAIAVNQMQISRPNIRNVSPRELNEALFPDTSPATGDQLRERLESLLDKLTAGADPERVRFLPKGDDES